MGRTLRAVRREAGLTQTETAKRAGVSREALSLIENGRSAVHAETLQRILRTLGYRLAFLPYSAEEWALREAEAEASRERSRG